MGVSLSDLSDEKSLSAKTKMSDLLGELESIEVDEGLSYQWIDQIPEETLLKILNNCMNDGK